MYHFLEKFLREGSLKRSRDNISGVIRVYSGDTDGFVGGEMSSLGGRARMGITVAGAALAGIQGRA